MKTKLNQFIPNTKTILREKYLEKHYVEHHTPLRINFEDEYWQHIPNSHTFENV